MASHAQIEANRQNAQKPQALAPPMAKPPFVRTPFATASRPPILCRPTNTTASLRESTPRLPELCAHYHFVPRPCQVRAGNQRGRVERAIRYVRDSFWAGRCFTTLECNSQALDWRDQAAHLRRWPGDDAFNQI